MAAKYRTVPTNVPAKRVRPGDSLTNLTGMVASVHSDNGNVLITMTSGHKVNFGLNESVTVNKPV